MLLSRFFSKLFFEFIFTIVLLVGLLATSVPAQETDAIALGNRRELFVDSLLIEKLDNLRLQLHRPHAEGVALQFDKPWEGLFSGYFTILNDGPVYRMYYRGLPGVGDGKKPPTVTCYAESADGITWTKPNLGLFEINGTRDNNVVLANEPTFSSNFSPLIDTRPGVVAAERYKAVAGNQKTGLVAFVSADGIHWKKLREEPIFTQGIFDSQNVIFWSATEQRYVCYFRTWTGEDYTGFRTISRTTSSDFLNWSDPVAMDFGDTPQEHLYTNATQPYYRAPHIYLAFPKRFFPEKAALSPEMAKTLVENPNYRIASSDAVFMSSRGGDRYDRTFMEAFMRPGPGLRDWVCRDNTPALGMIPADDRQLFLYRQAHYAQPTAHLRRYSLRIDGFVSVNAPYAGGELLTRPFTFQGQELEINYATSAAGGIRVEILTADGKPIEGYGLDDCQEIFGDEISHVVVWKNGSAVGDLAGKPIRLRFVMQDADLYALRFK